MIKRDGLGIVVQHNPQNPNYADGGDSASREAILALSGSMIDSLTLHRFEIGTSGLLVRHPTQYPWNNPLNFTRDQLIPYTAALHNNGWASASHTYIAERVFNNLVVRGLFPILLFANNVERDAPGSGPKVPDPLDPAHCLHLAMVSRKKWAILLAYPLGLPWFLLSLLVNRFTPEAEQNALIAMVLTHGTWAVKLYKWSMPDWKDRVLQYWTGWRDQAEIGAAIITKLESV